MLNFHLIAKIQIKKKNVIHTVCLKQTNKLTRKLNGLVLIGTRLELRNELYNANLA